MSRRRGVTKRESQKDPRFESRLVGNFVSCMMYDGKKSVSLNNFYKAMDVIAEKTNDDPLKVFIKAVTNVKPQVEVKSRRVGGATYQVPIEVRPERSQALAIRWLINSARTRSGRSMEEKLSAELLDASNEGGSAYKKKEEVHRMAEANKAFSHFRW